MRKANPLDLVHAAPADPLVKANLSHPKTVVPGGFHAGNAGSVPDNAAKLPAVGSKPAGAPDVAKAASEAMEHEREADALEAAVNAANRAGKPAAGLAKAAAVARRRAKASRDAADGVLGKSEKVDPLSLVHGNPRAVGEIRAGSVTMRQVPHVEPEPTSRPAGLRPLRPAEAAVVPVVSDARGPTRVANEGRLVAPAGRSDRRE